MNIVAESVSKGTREIDFRLRVADREVPGLLWIAEGATGERPLVLFGHGITHDKRHGTIVATAKRLVREWDCAAIAIDAIEHGDRATIEFTGRFETDRAVLGDRMRSPEIVEAMVEDWRAVIDAAQARDDISAGPVGYWGLSMGAGFGLPLMAADPRIGVAVLGLAGAHRPGLVEAAARVTCPVLFMVQLQDELVPCGEAYRLFDAIAGEDKRMHVNPGGHFDIPYDEFRQFAPYLGGRLRGAPA